MAVLRNSPLVQLIRPPAPFHMDPGRAPVGWEWFFEAAAEVCIFPEDTSASIFWRFDGGWYAPITKTMPGIVDQMGPGLDGLAGTGIMHLHNDDIMVQGNWAQFLFVQQDASGSGTIRTLWLKRTGATGTFSTTRWAFYINGTPGTLRVLSSTDSVTANHDSDNIDASGRLTSFGFSDDGSSQRYFQDGDFIGAGNSLTFGTGNQGSNVAVGGLTDTGGERFKGTIYLAVSFRRALTDGEQKQLAMFPWGPWSSLPVLAPATGPALEGYRFRNDDGSETTATWLAAQDTNVSIPQGGEARIRLVIDDVETGQYQLEEAIDGTENWRKVTDPE